MKSMGGVAVLHPQDSLTNHPDQNKSHRTIKLTHPSNPNFTDSRRRTPAKQKNSRYTTGVTASNHTAREFFAGSVFVDSPPPSSVPIPGFFTKGFGSAGRDDPTTELRRILGLNLS